MRILDVLLQAVFADEFQVANGTIQQQNSHVSTHRLAIFGLQ